MSGNKTFLILLFIVFVVFEGGSCEGWFPLFKRPPIKIQYICWIKGGDKIIVDAIEKCHPKANGVSFVISEQALRYAHEDYPWGGRKTEYCYKNVALVDPIAWDFVPTKDIDSCFDYVREEWVMRYPNGTAINGSAGKIVPSMVALFVTLSLLAMQMRTLIFTAVDPFVL